MEVSLNWVRDTYGKWMIREVFSLTPNILYYNLCGDIRQSSEVENIEWEDVSADEKRKFLVDRRSKSFVVNKKYLPFEVNINDWETATVDGVEYSFLKFCPKEGMISEDSNHLIIPKTIHLGPYIYEQDSISDELDN